MSYLKYQLTQWMYKSNVAHAWCLYKITVIPQNEYSTELNHCMTWFKTSSNRKYFCYTKLHGFQSMFTYSISFDLPNTIVKEKKQLQSFPILQISKMKFRKVQEFAFSCKASIRAEIWTQVLFQHLFFQLCNSLPQWKWPVLHSKWSAFLDSEYLDQGKLGK